MFKWIKKIFLKERTQDGFVVRCPYCNSHEATFNEGIFKCCMCQKEYK